MRLIVTRPEPDASVQARTLTGLGHEPILSPLFRIVTRPPQASLLDGAQALIVTSRNALRALEAGEVYTPMSRLPLFAVGEATAETARGLGFTTVVQGPGTAAGLAALIAAEAAPERGALLHLAGEVMAFDMRKALRAAGFDYRSAVVYGAEEDAGLSEAARLAMLEGRADGVLLMSRRAARLFSAFAADSTLIEKARLLRYYCLSAEVADRLAPAFAMRAEIADLPRHDRLLALLQPNG